jgi:hypothetical protein
VNAYNLSFWSFLLIRCSGLRVAKGVRSRWLNTMLNRLQIERFPIHIVNSSDESEKLSDNELEYAYRLETSPFASRTSVRAFLLILLLCSALRLTWVVCRYAEALAKHLETVLNRLPEEYNSMSKQYTSSEEGDMSIQISHSG